MSTSQVGKFIVGKTDRRFKMHDHYAHYVEAAPETLFTKMWEIDDWARSIWGYPHWVDERRQNKESWNQLNVWAVEYKRRGNKRRVYFKSDEELLQFIMRWSGE